MEHARILAARIKDWLISYLSGRVGIAPDEIDPQQTFTHYGLASIEALNLVRALEGWLGHSLSPTVAWNYPTIAELAQHLASDPDVSRKTSAVAPRSAKGPPSGETLVEPVAIVGMGCRFPGASDLEGLWQLLCDGRDAITTVPSDRWDAEALFDPDANKPGKTVSRWGGFLERLDGFDAAFFGISPREAPHLDPRQRLALEVTWEALEDAGMSFERLAGSPTGVFVATLSNDYDQLLFRDLGRVDAYSGAGTANSIVANRISYFFDWHGPSVALDTACSGSLVAIHLACQSLRCGECALAVAGGVSVNLLPNGNVFFSRAGVLSPHGRCKPFDSRADGIVRSEGVGIVVLKPLSLAQADGDRIYAVIRGSAVNQDGRSNGLMAPNGQAQQAVLRGAYQAAGVSPAAVQYVETHGTGTPLGDPIEVEALAAVLGDGRSPQQSCALGSLKSNLGHMEPAAGVAGVLKTALAISRRLLPPTLHFQEANPLIPFGDTPFVVQQTLGPWPVESEPLVAGVSSFGFGGTNAHLVLGEAPPPVAETATAAEAGLLPLSARSPQALADLAGSYRSFLAGQTPQGWRDVCYTASVRRAHHRESRLALVARSPAEAAEHLAAFLRGEIGSRLVADRPPGQPLKVAFVFSGQGSHWAGMGCELEREPVFQAALEECDRLLRQHVDWSLLAELARGETESRLGETDRAQPAIFAIQVALAALWRSWGIDPGWVAGQSLGEVAAAHVAGALGLEDAIRVVAQRSRLMKRAEGRGKTALVGLPVEQARLALAGHEDTLGVAGSNGPEASVLSGDPDALAKVLASLEKQGVFCRLLPGVEVAFHSPQMESLKGELVAALAGVRPRPATTPIYSTVTGDLIAGEELDATYWGRNLREPFLFADVVQKLIQSGCEAFLEIGPHPVLGRAIQDGLRHLDRQGRVWASLRRNEPQRETLLASLGVLYAAGLNVDWSRLHPEGGRVVSLPTYPWQRERYWFDQLSGSPTVSPGFTGPQTGGAHPLLGEHIQLAAAPGQHVWQTALDAHTLPYLSDHRVGGASVLPGAMYAEMALTAAAQAFSSGLRRLADVAFERPLVLAETGRRRVQLLVSPYPSDGAVFHIASRDAGDSGEWTLHARGKIRYGGDPQSVETPPWNESLDAVRARCREQVLAADHYRAMAARGLQYGQSFQAVAEIWRRDGEVLAQLRLPEPLDSGLSLYHIHPVLLDAGFQTVALASTGDGETEETYLPVGFDGLQVYTPPEAQLWCHVRLRSGAAAGDAARIADIHFLDRDEQLVAIVEGLRLQRLAAAGQQPDARRWLYAVEWQPQQALAATEAAGSWLVFADRGGLGQALAAQVAAQGGECALVFAGEPGAASPLSQAHSIDPDDPAAFQRLLARARQSGLAYRGIVYLWGLDLSLPDDVDAESLFAAVYTRGCRPVLYLAQALAQQSWPEPPRLWLVTCGTQATGRAGEVSAAAVAQAPLWGLGRVIAREHPAAWGGLIDLESCETPELAASLLAICQRSGDEDAFAVRNGQRYVARLVRRPELVATEGDSSALLRPDASYLVTGGWGGLGLCLAQWLVEQGARRLILMGRSPLPPRSCWDEAAPGSPLSERIAAIRRLEKMGATVYVAAADVADAEQLTAFLAAYDRAGWPPIRGVVHAAGVLQDQLLVNMTADALETVLRPKVLGAWLLHRLLAGAPLDFFVTFSSVAAILGQMGQANYAAANAFMDALAHYRRRLGLPATSINWGVWAEVGMAAQRNLQAQFERLGMYAFAPAQALSTMGSLLTQNVTQATVVNADWARLQSASGGPAPLLAQLMRESAAVDRGTGGDGSARRDEAAAQLLLIADPARRQAGLEAYLRDLTARTLRLDDAKRLPTDQSLTALGMDSIMAVELKNRVEANLPLTLSVADLIVGLSVAELAGKLNAQLAVDEDIAALLDEVEGIPLEEVEALLKESASRE